MANDMNVFKLEGEDLEWLRETLADRSVTTLRVASDGGIKIKANHYSWSPPLGQEEAA